MTGPNNNNEVANSFYRFVWWGDSGLSPTDIQLATPTALSSAFAAYVAVQGVGFVCNLTIYTFALLVFHLPPLLCVALASAVALFVGSKRPVFRKRVAKHLGQPQGERTSGKLGVRGLTYVSARILRSTNTLHDPQYGPSNTQEKPESD
jgi:hypothetical protein